jgi:Type IV secretion system pilin
MNFIKKLILGATLALFCFSSPTLAAQSVLPEFTDSGCDESHDFWPFWEQRFEDQDALKEYLDTATKENIEQLLACAMRTGNVQFWMVPYFIVFALEFIIEIAGLIVVLMIIVGAYYYIAGGVTDDKEKGKTIITHALGGFALTLSAWIIVNIILLALTS